MTRLEDYFRDKFTGGSSERFKDERGEYHASNVSNCPREWYWDFKHEGEDTWSEYFELGNMFEDMYGRALKHQYGEDRVVQDVEFEMHVEDGIVLVGESDWVVLKEGAPKIDKVIVQQDGTRMFVEHDDRSEIRKQLYELREMVNDSDRAKGNVNNIITKLLDKIGEPQQAEFLYEDQVDFVIETKTTKSLDWRRKYGHKKKHEYQLACYMWAFDCPGELVYMVRNDADEMVFEFDRNPVMESDIEIRVRRHHQNLLEDEPPDTDPLNDRGCKYCEWESDCKSLGGTRWA